VVQPARHTFAFVSGRESLSGMTAAIEEFCLAHGLPQEALFELSICLAEALNNILLHAYRNESGRGFSVTVALDEHAITALVTDNGPPFNPLQHQARVMDGTQEHGMGVHIYRSLMSFVDYQRLPDGTNQLILRKSF